MTTTIGQEYDHIDISDGTDTVQHYLKDTVARRNIALIFDPGNNLLSSGSSTDSFNNVTVTYSNGHFRVEGIANNSGGRTRRFTPITLPAGTYVAKVVNFNPRSGSYPELFLQNNSNAILTAISVPTPADATITLSSEGLVYLGINVVSGRTYDSDFDVQLEAGSQSTVFVPPTGTAVDYVARYLLNTLLNN